jgi:hypothetical protein
MAKDLKPFEVVGVSPVWRACTEPGKLYPGECFARSSSFISMLSLALKPGDPTRDDLWLVHGEYMGWHRHGWVELPGDVVFDGIFQQFYGRKGYYDTVFARPWYKYTHGAAWLVYLNMPLSPNGMMPFGNWHEYLNLPWADPNNPTVIDDKKAWELIQAAGLNVRSWLCHLGAYKLDVWMSASGWAKYVLRQRMTSAFVPMADRRTEEGRTRGMQVVLDANLPNTLVFRTKKAFITMRLEKRVTADSAPCYRFVEVGRERRMAS